MCRVYAKINVDWYHDDDEDGYGPFTTSDEAYRAVVHKLIRHKHGAATAHISAKQKLGKRLQRFLRFVDRAALLKQDGLDEHEQTMVMVLLGLTACQSRMYEETASATLALFGEDECAYEAPAWADFHADRQKAFHKAVLNAARTSIDDEAFVPMGDWIIAKLKEEAAG
jgi:hypothetical protein